MEVQDHPVTAPNEASSVLTGNSLRIVHEDRLARENNIQAIESESIALEPKKEIEKRASLITI